MDLPMRGKLALGVRSGKRLPSGRSVGLGPAGFSLFNHCRTPSRRRQSKWKGDPPMLVLSRKENEKILFPHLGIALQILRVGGGKVRLGVEAPSDVAVVRYEIADEEQLNEFAERLKQTARDQNHAIRNRLHSTL